MKQGLCALSYQASWVAKTNDDTNDTNPVEISTDVSTKAPATLPLQTFTTKKLVRERHLRAQTQRSIAVDGLQSDEGIAIQSLGPHSLALSRLCIRCSRSQGSKYTYSHPDINSQSSGCNSGNCAYMNLMQPS